MVPPEQLDLSSLYTPGLQANEKRMEDDTAAAVEADNTIVQTIVAMGFSENAGKRAALATGNSNAEAATNWLFGHMEDSNLNDPVESSSSGGSSGSGSGSGGGSGGSSGSGGGSGVDAALVQQICQMGFSSEQATFALQQPGNAASPDAAVMWLFGHQEDLPQLMAATSNTSNAVVGDAFAQVMEQDEQLRNARSGHYELVGFISHVGKSTGSGHYVCHIKKELGLGRTEWVIHNDRKIAISKNPPIAHGYIYLYRHVEVGGSRK